MTEDRIKDAQAFFAGGRWEFAYYAIGYAVECAIKSSVLSRIVHDGWIFEADAKKTVEDCRTHDFTKLIRVARLEDELIARLKASASDSDDFVTNWNVAKAWTVDARYVSRTEAEARKLYSAITDEPDGVLKWIRNYW